MTRFAAPKGIRPLNIPPPGANSQKSGHAPTLISAFMYFDVSFMVWVMLGPLAPIVSTQLHLDAGQQGLMVAIPMLAGALLRLAGGVLVDKIGPRLIGTIGQIIVMAGLLVAWKFGISSYGSASALGVILGFAGANFAVALPLTFSASAAMIPCPARSVAVRRCTPPKS